MAAQREPYGSVVVVACCVVWCVTIAACKDSGSSTNGSKSGFRLSLSKREVPVANKAAH